MEEIQETKETKIVEFAQAAERVIEFIEDDVKKIEELTQEEIIEGSNNLVKEIGLFLEGKMKSYGKPYPIAFILNAMMNVYVTTILSSMPSEMVMPFVDDHFSKIIKDIERMNKAKA